jgi:hypothetical protein
LTVLSGFADFWGCAIAHSPCSPTFDSALSEANLSEAKVSEAKVSEAKGAARGLARGAWSFS